MTETVMQRIQALDPYSALVLESIALERLRQIEVEGWTPEHDDTHADGELAVAAGCYAQHAGGVGILSDKPPLWWPWDAQWWKPRAPQHDLKRAGALIVAEGARRMRRAEASAFEERMEAAREIEAHGHVTTPEAAGKA